MEYFIYKGGNVNCQDRFGFSFLYYVVYGNNGDIIKFLLEQNVDFCLQDDEGYIVLDVVKIYKCKDVL